MIAQDRQPYLNTREDNRFQFFGAPTVMRSTGETTDGHFCLLEQSAMPVGLASPYHVHHNEDEAFYVLEGLMAFLCGQTWYGAGPGTWLYGPRDIPHGFRVIGTGPARMLLQCAPAGFEQFVRELSMPVDAVPAPPDMTLLVATAARYGVEILGPLPDMPAQTHSAGSTVTMTLAAAVEHLRQRHMAAVNGGDSDGAGDLFAADGVFLPPGQPGGGGEGGHS
jgi:quercetin dioxygenase-like cupin family protein